MLLKLLKKSLKFQYFIWENVLCAPNLAASDIYADLPPLYPSLTTRDIDCGNRGRVVYGTLY